MKLLYFLYFDPGLGMMIVQALVAAIAGFILFSKNLLYRIKLFFGFVKPTTDDELFDEIDVSDSNEEIKEDREHL